MIADFLVHSIEREIGTKAEYLTKLHELWSKGFWRLVIALTALRTAAPNPTARGVAAVSSMLLVDCGPCLEISVRMALKEGADRETIRSVLERNPESLSAGYRSIYELAQGVHEHAPEVVQLSADVEHHFGQRVRADVALTLAFAPIYPHLKRALGLATDSCVNPNLLLER